MSTLYFLHMPPDITEHHGDMREFFLSSSHRNSGVWQFYSCFQDVELRNKKQAWFLCRANRCIYQSDKKHIQKVNLCRSSWWKVNGLCPSASQITLNLGQIGVCLQCDNALDLVKIQPVGSAGWDWLIHCSQCFCFETSVTTSETTPGREKLKRKKKRRRRNN